MRLNALPSPSRQQTRDHLDDNRKHGPVLVLLKRFAFRSANLSAAVRTVACPTVSGLIGVGMFRDVDGHTVLVQRPIAAATFPPLPVTGFGQIAVYRQLDGDTGAIQPPVPAVAIPAAHESIRGRVPGQPGRIILATHGPGKQDQQHPKEVRARLTEGLLAHSRHQPKRL